MNISDAKRALISYRLKQADEALQDAVTLASHGGTPRTMINRHILCYSCPLLHEASEHVGNMHLAAIVIGSADILVLERLGLRYRCV